MPGSRESSSIRSWMGPSNTTPTPRVLRSPRLGGLPRVLDLSPQLGLEASDRVLRGGRRFVLLDRSQTGHPVASYTPDARGDAEDLREHLAKLFLLRLNLLHCELAAGWECKLQRRAVVGGRGGRSQVRMQDHLSPIVQPIEKPLPRATDDLEIERPCTGRMRLGLRFRRRCRLVSVCERMADLDGVVGRFGRGPGRSFGKIGAAPDRQRGCRAGPRGPHGALPRPRGPHLCFNSGEAFESLDTCGKTGRVRIGLGYRRSDQGQLE